MGQRFYANDTATFVAFLTRLFSGCAEDDVACAVRAIDAQIQGVSRIFLYPQALFISEMDPGASIVCYSPSNLGEKLDSFLAHRLGCSLEGDHRKAGGENGTAGLGALRTRNARHGAGDGEPPQTHCHAVRRLFARDAALWSAHCGASNHAHRRRRRLLSANPTPRRTACIERPLLPSSQHAAWGEDSDIQPASGEAWARERSATNAQARARNLPILFLHVPKSGGTSLCALARAARLQVPVPGNGTCVTSGDRKVETPGICTFPSPPLLPLPRPIPSLLALCLAV